jgi:cell division protein FtsB
MNWLVFSYTLPTGPNSSPRVTLWRRLRRVGAVAISGGGYLLPVRDECHEAFQWLAQEIRQAQGEALILHVAQLEGLSDAAVVQLFHAARRKEYAELEAQVMALEAQISGDQANRAAALDGLERLRRRFAEIRQVDYFATPEGALLETRLTHLASTLAPPPQEPVVLPATHAVYQNRRWATRPRPHVDRLACAWLIRRFIDPAAVICYTATPQPEDVTFDVEGGTFTHTGSLCTFETMQRAFDLRDPALTIIAELVHAIDLRDGQYAHPEIVGLAVILDGWLYLDASDAEREHWGYALFEGLHRSVTRRLEP